MNIYEQAKQLRSASAIIEEFLAKNEFDLGSQHNAATAVQLLSSYIPHEHPGYAKITRRADYIFQNERFHGFELPIVSDDEKLPAGTTSIIIGLENSGCVVFSTRLSDQHVVVIALNKNKKETQSFRLRVDDPSYVEWTYRGNTTNLSFNIPTDVDAQGTLTNLLTHVTDKFDLASSQ